MKNRSDKEMIRAFTELTEDVKICVTNLGLHFVDNEASTALKMIMTNIKMKYQLASSSYHRAKNS